MSVGRFWRWLDSMEWSYRMGRIEGRGQVRGKVGEVCDEIVYGDDRAAAKIARRIRDRVMNET